MPTGATHCPSRSIIHHNNHSKTSQTVSSPPCYIMDRRVRYRRCAPPGCSQCSWEGSGEADLLQSGCTRRMRDTAPQNLLAV
mmetsp:Transcript_34886/g.77543  ORF Transcript_34886/g.77543 Transcript_34886/m.77543 type:complete len:82 (+) Transcript_34886:1000-1245(+)